MNLRDDKVNFIMLVGLPGCGKTTYARKLVEEYGLEHISSDQIRMEKGMSGDQHVGVFEEMLVRTKENLIAGKSLIYDATNLHRKYRKALLENIKKCNAYKICIFFTEPFDVCMERNKQRGQYAVVPEYRMYEMLKAFKVPMEYEGWDDIIRIQTSPGIDLNQVLESAKGFDQDNEHHQYDLYNHLTETFRLTLNYCIDKGISSEKMVLVAEAAVMHDIGKLFTKTFNNIKGEQTDQAHYYGHDNVGAYYYLSGHDEVKDVVIENFEVPFMLSCKLSEKDLRTVAALINWHMRPYFTLRGTKRNSEQKLLGEDLAMLLDILHEADVKAH